MTNEQLRLLLKSYLIRLEDIVDEIDESMPEGVERHSEWWNIKTDTRANDAYMIFLDEEGKKLLEKRSTGTAICLDSLYGFIEELQESIGCLLRPIDIKGIV